MLVLRDKKKFKSWRSLEYFTNFEFFLKIVVQGINIFAIQFAVIGDETSFEKCQKFTKCLIEGIIFSKFVFCQIDLKIRGLWLMYSDI